MNPNMKIFLEYMRLFMTQHNINPVNVSVTLDSIYFADENSGQEFFLGMNLIPDTLYPADLYMHYPLDCDII